MCVFVSTERLDDAFPYFSTVPCGLHCFSLDVDFLFTEAGLSQDL